jgi:hypothetical protein
MRSSLLIIAFCLNLFTSAAFAQDEDFTGQSLRDITTVAAMGGAGAILGLSTLSFVDEPKDHLKNIVVGASLGVIIGVGWVAWGQANKSKGSYEGYSYKDLETTLRRKIHYENYLSHTASNELEQFRMNFSF